MPAPASRATPSMPVPYGELTGDAPGRAGGAARARPSLCGASGVVRRAACPSRGVLGPDRDLLRRLLGQLDRPLGDAAAAVQQKLQIAPDQIALRRDQVLRRAAAKQGVEAFELPLHALLRPIQPFARDVLDALGQDSGAFGNGLEVLRGLLDRFPDRVREAES